MILGFNLPLEGDSVRAFICLSPVKFRPILGLISFPGLLAAYGEVRMRVRVPCHATDVLKLMVLDTAPVLKSQLGFSATCLLLRKHSFLDSFLEPQPGSLGFRTSTFQSEVSSCCSFLGSSGS